MHNESEEDILEGTKKRSKQIVRSPKKKKIKKSPEKTIKIEKLKDKVEFKTVNQKAVEEKLNETIDSVIKLYESGETERTEEIALADAENETNDLQSSQIKPLEEITEWDCNLSVDVKHSPEHSTESGSGKFL